MYMDELIEVVNADIYLKKLKSDSIEKALE